MRKRKRKSWRDKMHPLFFDAIEVRRLGLAAVESGDPADAAKFHAKAESLRQAHPLVPLTAAEAIFATDTSGLPEEKVTCIRHFENLHWRRFREPVKDAVHISETGDIHAHRRVAQTSEDHHNWRFNKDWAPKYKGDTEHARMFELGLGLGLEGLTAEQLADAFDDFCQCGRSHDADALKKQRGRMIETVRSAFQFRGDTEALERWPRKR